MEIPGSTSPEAGAQATAGVPLRGNALPRPYGYEGAWRFALPVLDSSVPQVRHAVRDLIRRRRAPVTDTLMDDLLLILSELVTNSVRHAALLSREIGVEVSLTAEWVRIAVEDGHPYRPKALAADPVHEHTGGRGLLLVKTTVAEAGGTCDVEQTSSGGKLIWAALPLPLPLVPGR